MTINDILTFISLICMMLGFAFIPFSPLIMWYLADKFEIFDEQNKN